MSKRRKSTDREEEPQAKLAPIFSPPSQKLHGVWKIIPDQLLIYTVDGVESRSKVAGFDLDGTLIKTKSGQTFARTIDDWQFWSSNVISVLRKYHNDGYKVCIFTNQMGIQNGRVEVGQFKRKIKNICSAVALPLQVFVSVGTPNFRKPFTGMWERMEREENGGIPVNRTESLYVGDKRVKSDHSCADRLFALNLSVPFYTPEQIFAKQRMEEPYKLPEFNASQFLRTTSDDNELERELLLPGPSKPELVVLVGPPASGKSTFARRFARKYAIVSQDELGTWKACVDWARDALRKGRNVIIDNTNRDAETRSRYCELAASLSLPCRCLIFECSPAHAIHNNTFRQIIGADLPHKRVNDIAIRTFFSAFQEPTLTEGYSEIVRVTFTPSFENDEHRRIYAMYLTEK